MPNDEDLNRWDEDYIERMYESLFDCIKKRTEQYRNEMRINFQFMQFTKKDKIICFYICKN